jgi:RNA polymerase sigma-70 factor (ECF subfamily)
VPQERALERKLVIYGVRTEMNEGKTLSEKALLKLVQAGDREAYGEIVRKYMKSAYYIALAVVHNHQDALDLSQEAFVKTFRNIKKFDTDKAFFPWFYRLMKNLCLDHLKKVRRRVEVPLEESLVSCEDEKNREVKATLWRGIAALPFEQRELIILRYFQQFSYQEIAKITAKPVGTIMSSLYYAKRKLKEILAGHLGFGRENKREN